MSGAEITSAGAHTSWWRHRLASIRYAMQLLRRPKRLRWRLRLKLEMPRKRSGLRHEIWYFYFMLAFWARRQARGPRRLHVGPGKVRRPFLIWKIAHLLGVELVPLALPDYPVHDLIFVLSAEAAAAFDELTRSGRDEELVRQERYAWPNAFREARLIPAVEYLRANRIRRLMTVELTELLATVDVLVHPSRHGWLLAATNLSGHPTVVVPTAVFEGQPGSLGFTAQLFGEARLLAFAEAWQTSTGFHHEHPPLGD